MKWYKRLFFYMFYNKLPQEENKRPRSRIVNDPITWGDLCDKQPTWKLEPPGPWPDPPKQEKKPYYRVDFYDFRGDKPYWAKGFYQSIKYSIRLPAWSYWSSHDFYDITIEYMTEEEFDNLPDFKEPI